MRYGIISDIHGNIYAFEAVLSDAREQGVDLFLFLGDYVSFLPWANEVLDKIRNLSNKVVIRGNNEGYFIDLHDQKQPDWQCEQFRPNYWHYRNLQTHNLEYILHLPETAELSGCDMQISLVHSSGIFIRSPRNMLFHTSTFRARMEEAPFTHDEYLVRGRNEILSRQDVVADIRSMPPGIYLSGHNHLQFHMEFEGRIFINPGACGGASDFNPSAPYTILHCDGNSWKVEERRVAYDYMGAAKMLLASGFAAEAPTWSEIMSRQLIDAKEHTRPFLNHLRAVSKAMGQSDELPVSNEVWHEAIRTWSIPLT